MRPQYPRAIPARYATGYLGNIGVPVSPALLGMARGLRGWRQYTLDARHNQPRISRILMARGRDAMHMALTTSFGPVNLTRLTVWTEELAALASQPGRRGQA